MQPIIQPRPTLTSTAGLWPGMRLGLQDEAGVEYLREVVAIEDDRRVTVRVRTSRRAELIGTLQTLPASFYYLIVDDDDPNGR
jgi:hypothetical protein